MSKGNFKVKCINLCGNNETIYTKGNVYDVKNGHLIADDGTQIGCGHFNNIDDVNCFSSSRFEAFIDNQTIIIHVKDNETIATLKQGKEVIKSAKAKCSPTDEFNFEIGARLAFERLVGEDKPTYREVKRPAKIGEWVKIVNTLHKDVYNNGEIFKVKHLQTNRGSELSVGIGKMFVAMESEYVVLENYQPPIKEKTLADFTNQEIAEELLRRFL